MLMTTFRLLTLRIYMSTLGRFAFGEKILRRMLLKKLVHSQKNTDKYTASSRFFDPRELD